jgi:hypothetical protein
MPLVTVPSRPAPTRVGRQLMVLDDAETIARQARRRAAVRRRQREALQQVGGGVAFLGVAAVILGASPLAVGAVVLVLAAALIGLQGRVRGQQQVQRRRRRMVTGPGIGTPRPKGGFSTTRHRSGAPVWVVDRAA